MPESMQFDQLYWLGRKPVNLLTDCAAEGTQLTDRKGGEGAMLAAWMGGRESLPLVD